MNMFVIEFYGVFFNFFFDLELLNMFLRMKKCIMYIREKKIWFEELDKNWNIKIELFQFWQPSWGIFKKKFLCIFGFKLII
jgi:hypothetical protein